MLICKMGLLHPQTRDEIISAMLGADVQAQDVRAELYHVDEEVDGLPEIPGWTCDLIVPGEKPKDPDLVVARPIGFGSSARLTKILEACGVREIAEVG